MSIFFALFTAYLALLLALGWWVGRKETEEDFLIAGRDRSWFQVGMSKYAAAIGAGWFIAYSGFAYEYGWPVFLIFGGATAGVLIYAFWAVPRITRITNNQSYTLGDYVYSATSSESARGFVNATAVIMIILNLLIAIVGGASLLDTFGLFTYEVAVLLMVVSVVSYMMLSGFKAVMITDLVQGFLLLLLLPLIVYGLWQTQPPSPSVLLEVRDISILGMTMLSVFGIVSVFADPTRFQVTFAGKSAGSVTRGMVFSVVPMLLTGVVIFALSSVVYTLDSGLAAAAVFPTALQEYIPTVLVPFGFLAFFVAVMSTADSNLYALASHTSRFLGSGSPTRQSIRGLLIGYSVLLSALAFLFRDVIDLAVLTGGLLIIVAIPVLYLITGGTDALRFSVLMGAGWCGVFVGVVTMGLTPDSAVFVLLAFILAWLAPRRWLEKLA